MTVQGLNRPEQQTNQQYDLFISYIAEDRAWVEGYLFDALDNADVTYISEQAFILGRPRVLEFERAVQQSRRTLLVLSPAYLADGHSEFESILSPACPARRRCLAGLPGPARG